MESTGSTSPEVSLNPSQRGEPSRSKASKSLQQLVPAPKTQSQRLAVPSHASSKRKQESKSGESTQGHIHPLNNCQYILSDLIEDATKWSDTQRSSHILQTITSKSAPKSSCQTKLPNGKLIVGRSESEPLLSTDTNTKAQGRRVTRLLSAFTPSNRRSSHQSSILANHLPSAQNAPSSPDSNMSERPLLQSAPGEPNLRLPAVKITIY